MKWNESHLLMSDSLRPHELYVACQAPLSRRFSRQEYWSGLLFPSPGDLPNPGIKPWSSALQADSLPAEPPGKPCAQHIAWIKCMSLICRLIYSSSQWDWKYAFHVNTLYFLMTYLSLIHLHWHLDMLFGCINFICILHGKLCCASFQKTIWSGYMFILFIHFSVMHVTYIFPKVGYLFNCTLVWHAFQKYDWIRKHPPRGWCNIPLIFRNRKFPFPAGTNNSLFL